MTGPHDSARLDAAATVPLSSHILLVSNMYPSVAQPKFGSFVAEVEKALLRLGARVRRVVLTEPRTGRVRLVLKYLVLTAKGIAAALRGGYDQVHAHYLFPSGFVGLLAARARRVPLVLFAHGGDLLLASWRWPIGSLTRHTTRVADRIVVPSEHLKREVSRLFAVPADVIDVIPTAVDVEYWSPGDREDARARQGLDATGRYVLFAGALNDNKGRGFEEVVAALVDPRLADVRVLRVGRGPRADLLDRVAAGHGVAERIEARDFTDRDGLRDLYRAVDAVVVPSRHESLGLVALEAQACGTPVVATRVGGLPEHVRPGITGELYEPDDIVALADALYRVIYEPGRTAYRPAIDVDRYGPPAVSAALARLCRTVATRVGA